jgi:FkbM family methyltransferase
MATDIPNALKVAVRRGLSRATGNAVSQRALRFLAKQIMSLMGIGSGGDVTQSGEAAAVRLLHWLARPPFCIFDVGANRGQFMQMAYETLEGTPVQYHAFEPARSAFEALERTSTIVAAQPRPALNRLALGSGRGTATLYSDVPGSGLASLSRRRLEHLKIDFSHHESVDVTTLDDYCAGAGVGAVDLLKVDVEGHEFDVLSGATGLLKDRAIRIILFEFGGTAIDTRRFLRDFFHLFEEHAMSLSRVTPSGYLHRLRTYDEFDEQFRATNFVATLNKP